jgi:hypothetical protein
VRAVSSEDPEQLPFPLVLVLSQEAVMADDPSKKGPQDRSRINTSEGHEVRYWSQKFGVSPEELKAAVRKVGNSAKAVENELKAGAASQSQSDVGDYLVGLTLGQVRNL